MAIVFSQPLVTHSSTSLTVLTQLTALSYISVKDVILKKLSALTRRFKMSKLFVLDDENLVIRELLKDRIAKLKRYLLCPRPHSYNFKCEACGYERKEVAE